MTRLAAAAMPRRLSDRTASAARSRLDARGAMQRHPTEPDNQRGAVPSSYRRTARPTSPVTSQGMSRRETRWNTSTPQRRPWPMPGSISADAPRNEPARVRAFSLRGVWVHLDSLGETFCRHVEGYRVTLALPEMQLDCQREDEPEVPTAPAWQPTARIEGTGMRVSSWMPTGTSTPPWRS